MITRQDGCHPSHQQDGGIAILALMRRIARAVFIVGIVVLAVLLLTPGDYLPRVDLWDKLEHGLAFGVGLDRASHLAGVLAAAAPERDLQAVDRPAVREGARHR